MRSTHFVVLLIALLVSACSTQMPQNAEEFRKVIPTAFMGSKEEMVVPRAFPEISATFKKMAPKCLNITLTTRQRQGYGYSTSITHYTPTVIASAQKVELHVQTIFENSITLGNPPKKGMYQLVVDVMPTGGGQSKAVIYGPSMGLDTMIKGVKGWITGDNIGCPDLTQ